MQDNKGYIIVVTDEDMGTLLQFKEANNEDGIEDFFRQKLDELIM